MDQPLETVEHKGLNVELHQEPQPESPREWDNLSLFAFFHRNYTNEDENLYHGDFNGWDEMREFIESKNGLDAICLPVYLYSHSGDTVNTTGFSCPWDSGQLGFAYVTREKAREAFGWKRITKEREERVCDAIRGEVETFDCYLRGEVYGWVVTDKDGNQLDACWGYYDREYCIQEGKWHADGVAESLETTGQASC